MFARVSQSNGKALLGSRYASGLIDVAEDTLLADM